MSSPRLCGYIGLTILYNNKVYSKHTFLKLAKEPAVLDAIALRVQQHVVWDGLPSPFNKLVMCSDYANTFRLLYELMTPQEIAILAQFICMMDRFTLKNIKMYHNYFSELMNRKKKDMFGLRGWRQQIYIHMIPLRDLGDQGVKMLICGDIVETNLESFKPLLYPVDDFKKVKDTTRDLWSAHPNYRIRDIRFGSYSTKVDNYDTDVYYSFYTGIPRKEAFDMMLNCQSGEYDPYASLPVESDENPDTKKAEPEAISKLPPAGYGNNYARHETAKSSIQMINRQIPGAKVAKKWEENRKLKEQATKFFG